MTSNDGIDPAIAPSGVGCLECDAEASWWVHLRRCAECGHVGCCDDSLNTHATRHFQSTGHPVMQSFEPGEDWFWNYETETEFDGPELRAPHSHPLDQTAPGPADRVPHNWRQLLEEARR